MLYNWEESDLMEMQIESIIDVCRSLRAGEQSIIGRFGQNNDLVLFVCKDICYNREMDEDAFNIVSISTVQNGKYVDDTGDIHVNDERILHEELERIYNYRDFETL